MPAAKNSTAAATLHKIIAEAQAALSTMGINIETTTNETKTKTKKGGKAKAAKAAKPEGVKRGTAMSAFTAKMMIEKADELAAYKKERAAKAEAGELFYTADQSAVKDGRQAAGDLISAKHANVGAHLSWISVYKKEHADEWKAFEAEWNASNPKSAPTSSAASVAEAESEAGSDAESEASAPIVQPKKRGAKKIADMTPEQKAAKEAKKTAKKSAKAAEAAAEEAEASKEVVAPVAAPVVTIIAPAIAAESESEGEDEEEAQMMVFKLDGTKYFRMGTNDGTGKINWVSGDLWSWTKGVQGSYFGLLMDDGSIDTDAEEPNVY